MARPGTVKDELSAPYGLRKEQIEFYAQNGYLKLTQVFTPAVLNYYQPEISKKVRELNKQTLPLDQRSTYDKAFLQVMNLWVESSIVRELVFSARLARIATELMGCRGVRLYHDQALYKESGGGITPWHADQYYFPVSNDNVVTAWIPLQNTPLEMGVLAFCEKSHLFHHGRDLEISDESELRLAQALKQFPVDETQFALGDVSFHAGWTFHRASANRTGQTREVMTIIYMDQDMRLVQPKNKNQESDLEHCPGVAIGEVIDSPLNPVIFTDPS